MPGCKRAREVAASQAETTAVSVGASGVDLPSGVGVAVKVEGGVEVADGVVGGVAVESMEAVVVLGKGGSGADVDSLEAEVLVADGKEGRFEVGDSEIEVAVRAGIPEPAVRVIGRSDSGAGTGRSRSRNRKINKRIIATVNLKRS